MPNAILNVGSTGGQINISTAAAPATPAVGVVTLYAGTDKALHALNSDGTDITIAAAGAASPITVVQTNSLVSTGVGATGTSNTSIAIGFNSQVRCNDGNISIGACAVSNSQSGGLAARATTVVGSYACAVGPGNIALGQNSLACGSDSGLAVGNYAKACCDYGIAIGPVVGSSAVKGIAIGYGICNCGNSSIALGNGDGNATTSTAAVCAVVIGNLSCSTSACSTTIGTASRIFPGATGTIVLGNSSNGGTGACNSVVIGNTNCATAAKSISIGSTRTITSPTTVALTIGNSITVNGYNAGENTIIIGDCATSTGGRNITIGTCAVNCGTDDGVNRNSVVIGNNACSTRSSGFTVVLGNRANGANNYGLTIGSDSCAQGGGEASDAIGAFTKSCQFSVAVGTESNACSTCSVTLGHGALTTQAGGIAIGKSSTSSHTCAVALGPGITTERADTTHVNSLIAYGQAASKTNAVGSTGGSVTLNWDNSNIQTLTLTSNITTLTKSNPIDGAVYTLFLTQGGTGGKTVSWGADVDWPSGTAPTLSTAAGSVDAVSLVYIAGVTGYYGNANLNFS